MVTGVDLIQEQIKVAMGGTLPFRQSDIQLRVRLLHHFRCLRTANFCSSHNPSALELYRLGI